MFTLLWTSFQTHVDTQRWEIPPGCTAIKKVRSSMSVNKVRLLVRQWSCISLKMYYCSLTLMYNRFYWFIYLYRHYQTGLLLPVRPISRVHINVLVVFHVWNHFLRLLSVEIQSNILTYVGLPYDQYSLSFLFVCFFFFYINALPLFFLKITFIYLDLTAAALWSYLGTLNVN